MYNDIQEILEKAIKSYSGKRPKITFIEEDYQIDKEKGTVHAGAQTPWEYAGLPGMRRGYAVQRCSHDTRRRGFPRQNAV